MPWSKNIIDVGNYVQAFYIYLSNTDLSFGDFKSVYLKLALACHYHSSSSEFKMHNKVALSISERLTYCTLNTWCISA